MLVPTILLGVLAGIATAQNVTGALGDAQVVSNNPAGVSYQARLTGKVSGSLNATTTQAGKAVSFTLEVSGLPVGTGPFSAWTSVVPENGTRIHRMGAFY
jgi:hypothetical protein